MGLVDLGFVTGRGKPIVVGIVGSQNAGKTTLLAAWYLLLGRGTRLNSNWGYDSNGAKSNAKVSWT